MYNLKLTIEEVKSIGHAIKTNRLGKHPFTIFNPRTTCGITLEDLENKKFMRDYYPNAVRDFFEFLTEISDVGYVKNMLKCSGADALRMINLLLVKAERVRTAHYRRCDCHDKILEVLSQRNISTRLTASVSYFHKKNKNSNRGVGDKLFTWTRGSNVNYQELGCYLLQESKKLRNSVRSLNDMMVDTPLPVVAVNLSHVTISEYYNDLLKHFFNKNPSFLPADRPSGVAVYSSVLINTELLTALNSFSFTKP